MAGGGGGAPIQRGENLMFGNGNMNRDGFPQQLQPQQPIIAAAPDESAVETLMVLHFLRLLHIFSPPTISIICANHLFPVVIGYGV